MSIHNPTPLPRRRLKLSVEFTKSPNPDFFKEIGKTLCKITQFILSDHSLFNSALNLTTTLTKLSLPGWYQTWSSFTAIFSLCTWDLLSSLDAVPSDPALSSIPTSVCLLLISEKDGTLRLQGTGVCYCVSSVNTSSSINSKIFLSLY